MLRRNFIQVGSAAAGLASIFGAKSLIANQDGFDAYEDKSVVWLWLGGGPTQFETFHAPTYSVPDEYRPVSGLLHDSKTEIAHGGLLENLFKHTDKLNVVNSFTHRDSSHRQGTHYMMTGHYNPERANTSVAKYPSFGSIISACYGTNHPQNGMPSYVKQAKIEGDEGAWLGGAYKPFDPSNKDNLTPRTELERFANRRNLLVDLDKNLISGKSANSLDFYKSQAYDVMLGSAKDAFDVDKESEKVKEMYGQDSVGKQLLLARRLVEYGTRFVTLHYGGWDMHSNIKKSLEGRVPPVDKAIAAFLQDVWDKGLNEKVILIVTGEFGRTKLNANGGRDHWPAITPMLMAGGAYPSGRVIGQSDKAYEPTNNPVGPIDLQATLFDHFGIDHAVQRVDNSGRPRYLLEGEGKVFL